MTDLSDKIRYTHLRHMWEMSVDELVAYAFSTATPKTRWYQREVWEFLQEEGCSE